MSSFTTLARTAPRRIAQLPRVAPTAAASFSSSAVSHTVVLKKSISSVPEGTPLSGLGILKDKPDPLALADSAYPPWLWTLAAPQSASAAGGRRTGAPASQGGKNAKGGQNQAQLEDLNLGQEKRRLKVSNREAIKASNYLKATT